MIRYVQITLFIWLHLGILNAFAQSVSPIFPYGLSELENDTLFGKLNTLNDSAKKAILHGNENELVEIYDKIGSASMKIFDYETAEEYYFKLHKILKKENDSSKIDSTLHQLLNVYVLSQNRKKFDSLFPIAQKFANKLNSVQQYTNQRTLAQYYFNVTYEYNKLFNVTDKTLKSLDKKPISTLNLPPSAESENLEKSLRVELQLYQAFSLIKLDEQNAQNEGYTQLLAIENDTLGKYLEKDATFNEKNALINYYKAHYYSLLKDYKTASEYLHISDGFKYAAILTFEEKTISYEEMIYETIKTKEELKYTQELLLKDQALTKIYFISAIIGALLVLTLIAFLIYYGIRKRKLRLANIELENTNKNLTKVVSERMEFIARLSHELRTPIYGVGGLAEILGKEKDNQKKLEYFNTLKTSTKYLSMLIDNILQESRFSFEKNLALKTPHNISEHIKNICDSVQPLALERGVKLELKNINTNKEEYLLLDKVSLNQILLNLIYNSIKFSNKGDLIELVLNVVKRTVDNVAVQFEVIDNGVGFNYKLPADNFIEYQPSLNESKSSSGTGLGLNIILKLLKMYDSKLFFKTEINKGSHFKFSINFKKANWENPLKYIDNKLDDSNNRSLNILVVDDNKINLLISKKNVEKLNSSNCTTVISGQEAINTVKSNDFDLILMDINMPEMDGYEATREIKKIKPTTPIVALTALNLQDVNRKAIAAGMDSVITKPYDIIEFHNILSNYYKKKSHYNSPNF